MTRMVPVRPGDEWAEFAHLGAVSVRFGREHVDAGAA